MKLSETPKNLWIYIYLFIYFLISLCFLTSFPFVHSDEPWLSGLSLNIWENSSFSVTEPFFDTYQRYPHAIKILFHILQILFMKLFGYNIFSFRFISLLFALGSLLAFYHISNLVFKNKLFSFMSTLVLSLDIQFIYASHFARQEIIILFFMLLSTVYLLRHMKDHNYYNDIITGIIIGISIGFHPNSFIIAVTIGMMYLYLIIKKNFRINNLMVLIITVLLFACVFILLSLIMDGDFFQHYSQSGVKFGVQESLFEKFQKIDDVYKGLYLRRSTTAYMPNIKFELIIFALGFIISLLLLIKYNKVSEYFELGLMFFAVIGVNLGNIVIGRYNSTSTIFIFPFMILLVAFLLERYTIYNKFILGILLLCTLCNTMGNLTTYDSTYDEYIAQISKYVRSDSIVLSNLNTGYYFKGNNLYDYRNLAFIYEDGENFDHYINSRNIQYILYYDEMDVIYDNQPRYNGLYGDISTYYNDMKNFIETNCYEIGSFINPTYGTNIYRLIDKKDWGIHIYKVITSQ